MFHPRRTLSAVKTWTCSTRSRSCTLEGRHTRWDGRTDLRSTILCPYRGTVVLPSHWITAGITLRRCLIYFCHLFIDTVPQTPLMPSISYCFVLGFSSHWINSFNSCHRSSIWFRSDDSGGVGHQLIPPFFIESSCILRAMFRVIVLYKPMSIRVNSSQEGHKTSLQNHHKKRGIILLAKMHSDVWPLDFDWMLGLVHLLLTDSLHVVCHFQGLSSPWLAGNFHMTSPNAGSRGSSASDSLMSIADSRGYVGEGKHCSSHNNIKKAFALSNNRS